jgi:hypothetical protein
MIDFVIKGFIATIKICCNIPPAGRSHLFSLIRPNDHILIKKTAWLNRDSVEDVTVTVFSFIHSSNMKNIITLNKRYNHRRPKIISYLFVLFLKIAAERKLWLGNRRKSYKYDKLQLKA